jgi:hypothetical protein
MVRRTHCSRRFESGGHGYSEDEDGEQDEEELEVGSEEESKEDAEEGDTMRTKTTTTTMEGGSSRATFQCVSPREKSSSPEKISPGPLSVPFSHGNAVPGSLVSLSFSLVGIHLLQAHMAISSLINGCCGTIASAQPGTVSFFILGQTQIPLSPM